MYNALPMLTCEHDNYSSFYWILTTVKYVLRRVKISVEFVDGQSGSKGVGVVGEGKFPFPITQLLLKIEKKIQLVELLSIYADKLLYLKFFNSCNCLEVMGGKLILPPPPASLTIPINPLISKIERKLQLDELLSIYAEQLFYLKFY